MNPPFLPGQQVQIRWAVRARYPLWKEAESYYTGSKDKRNKTATIDTCAPRLDDKGNVVDWTVTVFFPGDPGRKYILSAADITH